MLLLASGYLSRCIPSCHYLLFGEERGGEFVSANASLEFLHTYLAATKGPWLTLAGVVDGCD